MAKLKDKRIHSLDDSESYTPAELKKFNEEMERRDKERKEEEEELNQNANEITIVDADEVADEDNDIKTVDGE